MNTTTKTYSNKSNAQRAAKAALVKAGIEQPLINEHFELAQVDGRYMWSAKEAKQPKEEAIVAKASSIAGMVGAWVNKGDLLSGNEKSETKTPRVMQPRQNNHTHPAPGTKCAQIWDIITQLSLDAEGEYQRPRLKDILEIGIADGFNPATLKTQWARWRQYHGKA